MNRADFQSLSRLRLKEARVLLRNAHYAGAYYLAGYAIECALKACIAKQIKRYEFPDKKLVNDSYTHDLDQLLAVSGLKPDFDVELSKNVDLSLNWAIVKDWSEQKRYSASISPSEAKDLYAAIAGRQNGVLAWLKRRW